MKLFKSTVNEGGLHITGLVHEERFKEFGFKELKDAVTQELHENNAFMFVHPFSEAYSREEISGTDTVMLIRPGMSKKDIEDRVKSYNQTVRIANKMRFKELDKIRTTLLAEHNLDDDTPTTFDNTAELIYGLIKKNKKSLVLLHPKDVARLEGIYREGDPGMHIEGAVIMKLTPDLTKKEIKYRIEVYSNEVAEYRAKETEAYKSMK